LTPAGWVVARVEHRALQFFAVLSGWTGDLGRAHVFPNSEEAQRMASLARDGGKNAVALKVDDAEQMLGRRVSA
jgi:hypothetical protein